MRTRKMWSAADLEFFIAHYPDERTDELAIKMGRTKTSLYGQAKELNLKKSNSFLESVNSGRLTKLDKGGIPFRFPKGHVPINKGVKGVHIEGTEHTWFKKGQLPHNTKHDGAITIRNDTRGIPQKFIRVALGKWEFLSRHNYQKHNGKIPKGFVIAFKDRDTLNCEIENLIILNYADNMKRNSIHRYPKELKDAMRTIGKLKSKIKQHGKK